MINNLKNILTQDSLATSEPIYVVYEKEPIVVDGDYGFDKVIYIAEDDGSLEMSAEQFEEFEELEE